ncbi:hypothetical protein ACGFSB_00620 [Streptomyces sp. NPDC048441]|uniref:hypothetical protein n=1 Tax=Streptomyces sp. NPDC048441 TaxID=3365552 RepID=UPI003713893C
MAILGNEFMTLQRGSAGRGLAVCASLLSAALITGCSSDTEKPNEPTGSPTRKATPTAPVQDEQGLGKKVKEALGTESIDDSDPLFVESGLERVSDGIHTDSVLSKGSSYELSVACAGRGKVSLSVGLKGHVRQTVLCDGVPVLQRITDSPSKVKISAEGASGATGMIGWRITRAGK